MFDQRGVVSLIKNRVKSDGIKEWICNEFCIRDMIKKKKEKKKSETNCEVQVITSHL